jgi:hypothetical protein
MPGAPGLAQLVSEVVWRYPTFLRSRSASPLKHTEQKQFLSQDVGDDYPFDCSFQYR